MTHRHHIPGRAWRLVMARLHHDELAEAVLIEEVGTRPHGWYRIAAELADIIHTDSGMTSMFVLRSARTAAPPLRQPPDRITAELLIQLAHAVPRLTGAACVGKADLFDRTGDRLIGPVQSRYEPGYYY